MSVVMKVFAVRMEIMIWVESGSSAPTTLEVSLEMPNRYLEFNPTREELLKAFYCCLFFQLHAPNSMFLLIIFSTLLILMLIHDVRLNR